MYDFASPVPGSNVSGLSGCVRTILAASGQRKASSHAGLLASVRSVRQIFYCLTYARAHARFIQSNKVILALGVEKVPDSPDRLNKAFEIVAVLLSGCGVFVPDTAGQAGQVVA